jgi:hypothetical protein
MLHSHRIRINERRLRDREEAEQQGKGIEKEDNRRDLHAEVEQP